MVEYDILMLWIMWTQVLLERKEMKYLGTGSMGSPRSRCRGKRQSSVNDFRVMNILQLVTHMYPYIRIIAAPAFFYVDAVVKFRV